MADPRCTADLHVHSHYSNRTTQWFFRKLGAQESYTPPERVYRLAKARGMTFVTITDHDAIDGALEIAHHKDAFVSEEITTHFPDDLSNIHVVALNITEAQHQDIVRCRQNIHELVSYLNGHHITHYLAHPLFASGAPVTVEKLEKLLLLFKNLEALNGSRVPAQQNLIVRIAERLTPAFMDELADRHGIPPAGPEPHRKSFVGGSDDHAGLSVARAYTVAPPAGTVGEFLQAIDAGRTRAEGEAGTALSLANAIYLLGYEHFRRQPSAAVSSDNVYTTFFGGVRSAATAFLNPVPAIRRKKEAETGPARPTLAQTIDRTVSGVWKERKPVRMLRLLKHGQKEETQRQIFLFINEVANRVLKAYGPALTRNLFSFDLMEKFETLGVLASMHLVLLPYYLSFRHQTGDRTLLKAVERHFQLLEPAGPEAPHVAVFSDSLHDVNGAAISLRRMAEAAHRTGKRLVLVGSSDQPTGYREYGMNFEALWGMPLPEYEGMRLYVPPFLEMLDWCEREGVTAFQISTPGPVGLAGLLAARLLNRPVIGQYHTHIPQFVHHITEDAGAAGVAWAYVRWVYGQMDRVLVPSESARRVLIAHGFAAEKLHVLPYGVDIERFHPGKRDPAIWRRFGINGAEKLLYVGRLSKEKNLGLLADMYRRVSAERQDLSLVIVGDGPYRQELRSLFNGHPVHFTGYLDGEELAAVYASADLFVFPSTTDTSGNVVLEAQASGLPVIVSDRGGPRENIREGETGLVAEGTNAESFSRAVRVLLDDPGRREAMGKAARAHMEAAHTRRYETILDQMIALCR
jgi:glycosyltransferase involved in cell wall biosynthesis